MASVLTFEHGDSVFEVEEGTAEHKELVAGGALLVSRQLEDDDAGEFGDLPVNELRAIAADRGLDVPKGTKKAELVALLEAAQPPEPDAEDPDAEPGAGGDELE
jgi:hypothetical protein